MLSGLCLTACSTKPQPINYGHDACSFCQMTIVDRQHAAQIVTVKGRSYKYDAIECMLNEYRDWSRPAVATFLVADYANPGVLRDATESFYLISEKIPSPMGEFLTAFSSAKVRASHSDEKAEELDWEALKMEFDILENQSKLK